MTKEDAYVTVNPAVASGKFNVVVMKRSHEDEWMVYRISGALSRPAADSLALSWAAATGLEIR